MMQANEFTLRRTAVPVPVQLPAVTQEQSVELDYVLPDYYPDFFRLLSSSAGAEITEQQLRDGVLDYAMTVRLTVLYCADPEQSAAVQAVHQQLEYRRQFTLPPELSDADVQIRVTAEPSYLNCRAVSGRRMDLRGAVRIRVSLSGVRSREVLTDAEGKYLQSRAAPVTYVSQLLRTEKYFTLSDDITVSPAQPPMLSVLRERITPTVTETRIVAGKMLVKGEADVELLYASQSGIETLHASLPFSQIAEQEGLSDDMPCTVTAECAGHLITPEAEQDGDLRNLHCDMQIRLRCTAVRTESGSFLTDLYSTVHPVTLRREALTLLSAPAPYSETLRMKVTLRTADRILTKVYAAWAEPEEVQTLSGEHGTVIQGMLRCCVMASDEAGVPMSFEQREPFTWELPELPAGAELPPLRVTSCTYTLTGSDSVVMQPELSLSGQMLMPQPAALVTDADIDEAAPLSQDENYALRLYFGQENESVWEIAKRYHTAADAIRAENDLTEDLLPQPRLLLIPTVR